MKLNNRFNILASAKKQEPIFLRSPKSQKVAKLLETNGVIKEVDSKNLNYAGLRDHGYFELTQRGEKICDNLDLISFSFASELFSNLERKYTKKRLLILYE